MDMSASGQTDPDRNGRPTALVTGASRGIGKATAARLLSQYGPIEAFPESVLGERRAEALLFKDLATLRVDAPLFQDVDELRWSGPGGGFAAWAERIGDPRLLPRCASLSP